ncbi:DUF4097 family beta strand repeat-containing protein [Pontibacter indicus]|uniref:Putative adhesin n=1 Tax=Pontibacter indicus TaxID=1317125 RepID=A0A1R3WZQ1_9BACT|nr:DUF4097 family beta strand repeat-containing protein [Pontibacter indicus]SIT84005.1 Putative adhesin [Pontibacter indicus]
MKRNILFLIFLMLGTPLLAQSTAGEEIRVPLTKPNEAGSLEISLVTGSISVTGTKGKEVVIKASAGESRTREREEAGGLKRIPNTNLGLTVTEQNNKVQLSTEAVTRRVNLEIQVPQNFSLRLSTVNNGELAVRNVNGNLELSNVNGSILLENVSGNAVANTTNGYVKANILRWDGKSPMAFSTLNGNVDVTLPANSKFNTKLRSDRGEVYTDFEMTQEAAQTKAGSRNEKGLYRVSTADFISGKVNGGGPEILIKNMNGNIYLRKATK